MVKSHEDPYWPDSLSLFSVSCEHYREPKKQNYGTEEKSQKDQVVTASKPSKPLLT